ncbi:MAG: DUF4402 domain-containing protein [Sphingomonas sp.]|jgi:Mat/Ecp fimbriae major subunit|uniref:DUF4402 domain-containing protein n=1 Tax=Sphingomonas sp. TaxID=28214 RepID=UPI0025EF16BD|nr:DUF4402 domain-containing protein [Sphingomonas sp.]MBX9880598.1 DUF4402 domain-containing protein [Sphingomonas sp.]
MQKLMMLGLAGLGLSAMAAPAAAQTATGDVSVRILQAITVSKTADLNFGRVVAGTAAGSVVVAEDGTRTCPAALRCLGTTTGAAFAVTGTVGETVVVAIDTPTIQLTSGTNRMSVALATQTRTITLVAGANPFRVGGTLSVGASQAAGTYTGQFTVSVNYQ